MTIMNYGGNLAQSLLSTLEHDPAFRNVAYFSMEIGLTPEIPTYSGGLGVLAGDILKSAADLGVPMVGVTLLYSLLYAPALYFHDKGEEIYYGELDKEYGRADPLFLQEDTLRSSLDAIVEMIRATKAVDARLALRDLQMRSIGWSFQTELPRWLRDFYIQGIEPGPIKIRRPPLPLTTGVI